MCLCVYVFVGACACACVHERVCSHAELKQWRYASKQLQDEGFAVQDVELSAAELHALAEQRVTLVVCIHLQHTHTHM